MPTLYEKINSEYPEIDISDFTENNYFMVLSRIPNLMFRAQTVSFPDVTPKLVNIAMPHREANTYDAGTAVEFGTLSISYILDEYFKCYMEMYEWVVENCNTVSMPSHSADGTILITNNAKKPILRVGFKDLIPSYIGGFDLDSRNSGFVTFKVSFKYTAFDFLPYKTRLTKPQS